MKILIFCTSILTIQASILHPGLRSPLLSESERAALPPVQELLMKVNHFDENDENVFKMRYVSNGTYYKSGPMLIFLGGEQILEAGLDNLRIGMMHDMAKELGGYMFLTEHRYYGQSVPNMNLETENLRYFTIDQALADIAEFIKNRKEAIPELQNSKIIVIGGSYAGSLAAWMRLYYPDSVDAALSSSGLFNLKVNNFEYMEIVQKKLSQIPKCLSIVTNAFQILNQKLFFNPWSTLNEVQRDFGACYSDNLLANQEKLHLLENVQTMISKAVQEDNPKVNSTVKAMCNDLILYSDKHNDDYYSLATVFKLYMLSKNIICSTSYAYDLRNTYRNTIVSNSIWRLWNYQLCTELGFITRSPVHSFLNSGSLQYWYKLCYDSFGLTPDVINKGIANTRRKYGGLNPNVTNVVFTVGTEDPWSGIGMTHSPNENNTFFAINGSSHCNDIIPLHNSEAISVARHVTKQSIYSWIK